LHDCHVEGQPARCGTLDVAENPRALGGRRLALPIVVLTRTAPGDAHDPIVILAGGPGQAATTLTGFAIRDLATARRDRDVVLVDQRGSGGATRLDCPRAPGPFGPPLDARGCAARLGRTADLSQYGTDRFVDDLEAARLSLGYRRIVLYGMSYGSRAAYAYARKYPGHVSAAVLIAAAPVEMPLMDSFGEDSAAALDAIVADCLADRACAGAFPRLKRDVAGVRARLTDRQRALGLAFVEYSSSTAVRVPLLVTRAAAGDWAPLDSAIAQLGGRAAGELALGLHLTIVCGEDYSYGTRSSPSPMRKQCGQACAGWPAAPVPVDFHRPVLLAIPALVIAGEWDPVTAPRWAHAAAGQFRPGRVVLLPKTGHVPEGYDGCLDTLVRTFLDTGQPATTCATRVRRLPYALR
jgi:pimeloyl-ACP methyl ester carboxylesterase